MGSTSFRSHTSFSIRNVLIFIRPKYLKARRQNPEKSRRWALHQALSTTSSNGGSKARSWISCNEYHERQTGGISKFLQWPNKSTEEKIKENKLKQFSKKSILSQEESKCSEEPWMMHCPTSYEDHEKAAAALIEKNQRDTFCPHSCKCNMRLHQHYFSMIHVWNFNTKLLSKKLLLIWMDEDSESYA